MQIVKQKEYEQWKGVQEDAYEKRIFEYAEIWATSMEEAMKSGYRVEDIADELSKKADTDGITGFMYNIAVQILSTHWIHGDALRRWHNSRNLSPEQAKKANKKGGVVNTAILTIAADSDEEVFDKVKSAAEEAGFEVLDQEEVLAHFGIEKKEKKDGSSE